MYGLIHLHSILYCECHNIICDDDANPHSYTPARANVNRRCLAALKGN